jgi:hypothetical protein
MATNFDDLGVQRLTDASMLLLLLNPGTPNTTEIVDVTYDLVVLRL